jgi:hypothetical protein
MIVDPDTRRKWLRSKVKFLTKVWLNSLYWIGIYFIPYFIKLDLLWEIQPFTKGGCGPLSAEAFSRRFPVVRNVHPECCIAELSRLTV